MIKKVRINNLKCIQDLSMECSNVNLLIGTNSSGKTSIIQSLLLLAQNRENAVGLNGNLLKLGTLEENRCRFSYDKTLSVRAELGEGKQAGIKLAPFENKLEVEREYDKYDDTFAIAKRMFQYLSCQRVGPADVYGKNMALEEVLGNNGEYAIAYLNDHGFDSLEPEMCKEKRDYTLLGQVNWWLKYIVDTEISTEEIPGIDLVKAVYRSNEVLNIRPGNIGAGVSYIVSILIMCLSSPKGSVNIIENPEIHLHPGAQAKICEFFYFIAQNGRQLFIESHSDHIFNGFRAGISSGEMKKEFINIQFVNLSEKHISESMRVEIGTMGKIINQKKDLFDQFDLDLNKMIGI